MPRTRRIWQRLTLAVRAEIATAFPPQGSTAEQRQPHHRPLPQLWC
ncbi:hypothetical protein ACFVVM_27980 [Nocardia sp. NPDC058176]